MYFTEFGDAKLYRWFESVGLTPRKSLTLGAIDVPDRYLMPLLRGLFEGDGTIQNFTHRPTPNTQPQYTYERLWLYFASASRAHVEWIASRVSGALTINGYVETQVTEGKRDFYRLKYGKHGSIALLARIYPDGSVPRLIRKWKIWDDYRRRCLNGAEGGI